MRTVKISIGNSYVGYDSADATVANGTFKVVAVYGRKRVIAKAIAALNRGEDQILNAFGEPVGIQVWLN
jgi:hypothetical protein